MGNFIKIVVFIGIGLLLNQIVNLIFRMIGRKKYSAHLRFFKRLINVVIIVLTIYILAQQFEVTKDMSTALLQSGSLIVAIATFAAQQALSNVISGFSLSLSKPYDVNDKIRVVQGGSTVAEGIVTDITIRHTIISLYNGESCIVPNSIMDSSVITNTNFTENIGNFLEVEITYQSNITMALAIMKRICVEHELTLNTEENNVFVKGYSSNGVVLKTTVWTKTLDENFKACSEIRQAIVEQFQQAHIEIPYHNVTVYSRKVEDEVKGDREYV